MRIQHLCRKGCPKNNTPVASGAMLCFMGSGDGRGVIIGKEKHDRKCPICGTLVAWMAEEEEPQREGDAEAQETQTV